ncbi:MAG TPA: hypothetical protein EYP67_01265 [Methanosarcinales archaeon]|nr:hypothetical protein [Methanosarcinales archaeon]
MLTGSSEEYLKVSNACKRLLEEKTSQAYFDAAAYGELSGSNLAAFGTTPHGTVVVPVMYL